MDKTPDIWISWHIYQKEASQTPACSFLNQNPRNEIWESTILTIFPVTWAHEICKLMVKFKRIFLGNLDYMESALILPEKNFLFLLKLGV